MTSRWMKTIVKQGCGNKNRKPSHSLPLEIKVGRVRQANPHLTLTTNIESHLQNMSVSLVFAHSGDQQHQMASGDTVQSRHSNPLRTRSPREEKEVLSPLTVVSAFCFLYMHAAYNPILENTVHCSFCVDCAVSWSSRHVSFKVKWYVTQINVIVTANYCLTCAEL